MKHDAGIKEMRKCVLLASQVAQARNMSIGEHRLCCVTFEIWGFVWEKTYRFCNLQKWKDFNKKQFTLHKMCVTSLLCGPWADPWPFYGLYCKRFSLPSKVYYREIKPVPITPYLMAINWLGNHTGKKKHNLSKVSRYLFNSFYIRRLQKQYCFSPIQFLIFWTLRNSADGDISSLGHLCWHKVWKIKITPIM